MSTDNKDWNVINDGAYGQVFEKKDGTVIITATWDGKGFKYTSHYPPKALNEDTIQSKGVGDIQELLAEVLQYFDKDTTNVPQDLYKEVFNFLYPPTTPTSNADTKGEILFKTEDGVDIYADNLEVYSVCPKSSWETRVSTYKQMNWRKERPDGYVKAFKSWLHFYSKEKREQYILENKPCLSSNDIKWWLEKYFNYPEGINTNQLAELVKQKLNH